jgi:hypothetical protein
MSRAFQQERGRRSCAAATDDRNIQPLHDGNLSAASLRLFTYRVG